MDKVTARDMADNLAMLVQDEIDEGLGPVDSTALYSEVSDPRRVRYDRFSFRVQLSNGQSFVITAQAD